MPRPGLPLALTAALSVLVAACAGTPTDTPYVPAPGSDGRTEYPLTIANCGVDVVFDAPPERLVLLETAPVTTLDALGVLDRVVSVAGVFDAEYYEPDLARRIDGIEKLSEDIDVAGHLMLSPEVVVAQEPDLVFGLPEGVTREALLDAGANALVQPVFCPTGVGDASFEALYQQVLATGLVFDRNIEARRLVDDLTARVAAAREAVAGAPPRTAAVLYPSVGGGPLYAYGRASMAQPQLEAAGLTNVFEDSPDRVFEVSVEELVGRDPEVLILLYQGEEEGVVEAVTDLPGADAIRAIADGEIIVQLFNFTEPPTPLSVVGLERIVDVLGDGS